MSVGKQVLLSSFCTESKNNLWAKKKTRQNMASREIEGMFFNVNEFQSNVDLKYMTFTSIFSY